MYLFDLIVIFWRLMLLVVNLHTIFEVYSFNRTMGIEGLPKF